MEKHLYMSINHRGLTMHKEQKKLKRVSDAYKQREIDLDFSSLVSPKEFNREIWNRLQKAILKINVRYNSGKQTFPNICLLIAGIIDFYQGQNVTFVFRDENKADGYINNTQFNQPYNADVQNEAINYPFDKVWVFSTPEGISKLTDAFVDKIRTTEVVEEGVLRGITWCIYETMDNVLQHAACHKGMVMGQLMKESHRIAISIFDYGRGIYNSFKDSNYPHMPRSPKDAISLALQEKVTRDPKIGQGNGMWGLSELVINNGGLLRIISGGSGVAISNGNNMDIRPEQCLTFGGRNACTLVDFQLDYKSKININAILGGMVDLWMEDHETDNGEILFKLINEADGSGTRQAAERLRNAILNAYNESHGKIIIDFEGINFMSSSFADELLGKLLAEFGLVNFTQIFSLKNITKQNKIIINRSVQQRMAQMYYDKDIPEP